MFQFRPRDVDYLRRLATRLFTNGEYADADQVLAELSALTPGDGAQIALRRAQIGMLGDRMGHVQEQLDLAREEYGSHVYFVGLEADMAVREGDLPAAAAALRLLGRHARAEHLEGFDGDWYRVKEIADSPASWIDGQALPLFDVTVNGQTGRFVLDTGTGDCLLDSDFARRTGLDYGHFDQAKFAGGRVGHWQLARIDSLCIGGSRFERLPASIAPLGAAFRHGFADSAVDGIVGAGLLRAAGGIDIDYQASRFRLGCPDVQADADGAEALWIAGPHYPLTSCRVNGGPASSWFIDSGMSGVELACSDSAAGRHGGVPMKTKVQAHGGGGELAAGAVRMLRFQHGPREYHDLTAAVLPDFQLGRELGLRIGGIIGHEWLARHRVRLDYRAMRVLCTPGK